MKPTRRLIPYERLARRIAEIGGSMTASAQALAELEKRRAAGEQVGLFLDADEAGTLWVGPAPAEFCGEDK